MPLDAGIHLCTSFKKYEEGVGGKGSSLATRVSDYVCQQGKVLRLCPRGLLVKAVMNPICWLPQWEPISLWISGRPY